ncbi:FAD-binding oxidoreductase [Rhodococcus sp. X156]|uniref:FAD-binding oxidoreductase n=1 Tax=Rhodococcus sp. X156 TaxID=2499145 RepID=UPI000FD897FE|nr:FAD-binding oxidoreductase [Rhodococcus sp. X156]
MSSEDASAHSSVRLGSVWHGWGDPARRAPLPRAAREHLAAAGLLGERSTPVPLEQVRLPDPLLSEAATAALVAAVGIEHVRTDRLTRVLHAGGKSYLDLLRRRRGDAEHAPDAVVCPADHQQVRQVLQACVQHEVAVVPFGGGTSVVGGVEPLRGRFSALVALDLTRLDALVDVDPVSMTATLQAGMRGPQVERELSAHGLTLGHFPQSWEQATVGGFVATRSAGQASTGYGRFDEVLIGATCATPSGDLVLGRGPASAAGPRLLDVVVGSEGRLGVVTSATVAVRPAPAVQKFTGWSFPSFAAGTTAFRALAQQLGHGVAPDSCRLSDEEETTTTLRLAGGSLGARALRGYLRARGRRTGSLAIFGWDGTAAEVARRSRAAAALLRQHGGVPLGSGPGQAWSHGRFHAPYLRDELLDHGVLVETLETATSWRDLPALHTAVAAALRRSLTTAASAPLVQCHVSHVYRTGASLYFTVVARQDPTDPEGQWLAAKRAASDVIAAHGAPATHQHAVGTDHAPWMAAEVGETGLQLLRSMKDSLDPTGILNPGKMMP